uniref:Piwi domain-containing protein n=1 Tax=Ignisphaera aggregans TaxID=334771 RepID=A0A7J3Z6U8_9CREN
MYESLILNGIYTAKPIDVGLLKCYKALLRCNYGECKRRLHGVLTRLILRGQLATYELREESPEKCLARIYVKDYSIIDEVKSELHNILDNTIEYVGEEYPPHPAIETFFDLLADVAFKEAGFEKIKSKGVYLDRDKQRAIGKRTVIKIEHDNAGGEKYHGILFIDYSNVARSSLADKLLEELGVDDFTSLKENSNLRLKAIELASSYIGKTVLTLVKRGTEYEHVYGKIVDLEPVFAREWKLPNEQSIHNLWFERYRKDEKVKLFIETEPSEWEFPLFKVEVERVRKEPLTYPPSLLKPIEAPEPPDPITRWDNIRKIVRIVEDDIKRVYKSLTGEKLEFRYIKYDIDSQLVGVRLNFYTGSDSEKPFRDTAVKLKYRDSKGNERSFLASPLYVFNRGCVPYAGRQELKLLVVYPSTISRSELEKFVNYLSSLFRELNFGNIVSCNYHSYTYDSANLSESLTSLEKAMQQAFTSCSKLEYLLLVIIPDSDEFYELSKRVASSKGFHTQLLGLETFSTAAKYISIIESSSTDTWVKQRVESALRSLIANVCGGMYVEYLIQKSIALGKASGPLTWILAEPADGSAQSMYVGLDVSTKRGVSGVAFILLDPYGKLIDAKVIQLKSEVLRYQEYYDVLRYMVSKAREQGLKRIVILRDGIPRTSLELSECLQAFNRVTTELKYETELEYVAVIKRSTVRIFGSNRKTKLNPLQGTYTHLYKIRHLGYNAHEVLVVASKPERGGEEREGTVRPIILRIYELRKTYSLEELKRIAEEYLALTRLNFWNIATGVSKLALPVKMADILSYMLSMGIPIKA